MLNVMKTLAAAAILTGGMGLASAANAMPVGPGLSGGDASLVQVRYGCGRGWHPTPRGCRPNRPPPPRYYGPRRHHPHYYR